MPKLQRIKIKLDKSKPLFSVECPDCHKQILTVPQGSSLTIKSKV